MFKKIPSIPIAYSLRHNSVLSMRSYAFEKSINAAQVFCLFLILVSITEVKLLRWSTVERPTRNPFCSSQIMPLSSTQPNKN